MSRNPDIADAVTSDHAGPALTVIEPNLLAIPEGWFLIGCETGQDCERPIHRVWIDAFLLAATQVTNAEYARLLGATGAFPPPFWNDPNFNRPDQPVTGVSWHEAVRYCDWLSAQTGRRLSAPYVKPNGSARRAAVWNKKRFRGAMTLRNLCRIMRRDGRPGRSLSRVTRRMDSGFSICATTCTSGAAIGTTRIIMQSRRSAIHAGRTPARASRRAEDRGGTTSKFRDAQRGRAFLQNFSMPTTASA